MSPQISPPGSGQKRVDILVEEVPLTALINWENPEPMTRYDPGSPGLVELVAVFARGSMVDLSELLSEEVKKRVLEAVERVEQAAAMDAEREAYEAAGEEDA